MCATTKLALANCYTALYPRTGTYRRFPACICSQTRRSYSALVVRCVFYTGRRRFPGKDKLVSAFSLQKFPAELLRISTLASCGKIVPRQQRANHIRPLLSHESSEPIRQLLCCHVIFVSGFNFALTVLPSGTAGFLHFMFLLCQ